MTGHRGLLLLGLPILAAFGLIATVWNRPTPERAEMKAVAKPAIRPERVAAVIPSHVPPAKDVATAVVNSRIRTTLMNYRAAVADKNDALQKALLPVLKRDLETARLYAKDDLARAKTERERAAALRTLEALER